MKKLLIFLLFIWSIQLTAQVITDDAFSSEILNIDKENLFLDSAFVDSLIGDKRIILLGELDHGDGSSFEVKTRMIKYLHEKYGFNKLVFESGLIDCNQLWKAVEEGESISDLAKEYIYFIWSQVKETEKLFQYIDDEYKKGTPLKIAGIDPQFSGRGKEQVFIKILERKLAEIEINSSKFKELSYELEIMSEWLKYPKKGAHKITESTFYEHLAYYKKLVLSRENEGELMNLFFENIEIFAALKWERRDGAFKERDQQMFRNLDYWLNEEKEEKVIVWAANAHIIRNDDQLKGKDSDYNIIGIKKLGDHIFNQYPEEAYSIAISARSGHTTNFLKKHKTNKIGKNRNGSLEEKLKEFQVAFIDLKLFEQALDVDTYESQLFYPNVKCISKWSNNFDAVIFINEMKPSTPLW